MIYIKFNQSFEDRVSMYFKIALANSLNISATFVDVPAGFENEKLAFWQIKYLSAKDVNPILNILQELKKMMGVDDLQFSFAYNEKEYFTQYQENKYAGGTIWLNI